MKTTEISYRTWALAGLLALLPVPAVPAQETPRASVQPMEEAPQRYQILFLDPRIEPWGLAMFSECRAEFERLSRRPVGMSISHPNLNALNEKSNVHIPPGKYDVLVGRGPSSLRLTDLAAQANLPMIVPECDAAWIEHPEHLPPNVYISTFRLSPGRTAETAIDLFPRARKLVVISGAHDSDRFLAARAREELGDRFHGVEIEYWNHFTLTELKQRAAALPEGCLILFLKMTSDPDGTIYIPRDVVREVVKSSSVPAFGFADVFLEEGVLGGYVMSSEITGKRGGKMLARLAAGESLPAITHVDDYGEYQFNWEQMKRWGIRERQLPDGARILYRPDSFLGRHPWVLGLLLSITTLLTVVIVTALLLLRNRHQTLDLLRESEERYRRAQTISRVGSWEYDLQTSLFTTSDEGKRIYGFDPDDAEFSTDEVEKCIPERERVHQALVDLVEKNKPYNLEFEIRPRNGAEPRIITSIAELKRDEHGAPQKIVGVIQDITKRKQMEEALRESETRLRLIVNQSPLGICVNDLDGRYVSANPAYEALTGYTEQELLDLSFYDLTHPDDRPANRRLFDGLTAEDSHNFTLEKRYIRKDGSEINVIVHGGAICDASGTPRFGLALVEDITERKRTEAALRESEARARLMADLVMSSNQPVAVGYLDGRLGRLNPAFCELTGYTEKELLAIDWSTELTPPEWGPSEREALAELERTGEPVRYEKEYIHKNGTRVPIELFVHLSRDADGNPDYYYAFITDITERKEAHEALQRSERELKASQETARLGNWELDLSTNQITWSDEVYRIFGMKPGEVQLTYETLRERVHPEDRAYQDQVTEQIATQGSARFEYRVVLPNGDIRWISGRGETALDETGQPVRIYGIAQDITERKLAEQELQQAHDLLEQRVEERTVELKTRKDEAETLNRAMINLLHDLKETNLGLETAKEALRITNSELEAFSYSVSHDLRAPLRHIDGFVKMLLKREKEQLDETSARYLDTIAQSSGRMGRLIDDLLAFSRTGRAEMHGDAVDSKKMIEAIVEEMAPITQDRQLVWEIGDLPVVQADGGLLRQVWQNLIGNAIKYTAPREVARIEIGWVPESGEEGADGPAFFIRDNGVGFDPQYTHKLYGVFQRLHRDDEFEGTGIGLATVRRIVHRHGGRVWAEGDLDHGATFYFTLKRMKGAG